MADPRTFTLIGEFKDGITPELEKINKQLAALKTNFAGIGNRKNTGFRGATQEIGKLVSAHKKLSESIKGVEGNLRSTVGVLQQYRREMGKAAAATRAFQKAGGNLGGKELAKDMIAADRAAKTYLQTLKQIQTVSRRTPRGGNMGGGGITPPRPPRGGGAGGGITPPRPPRGGGAGGGPGGFHMAEFGFAYTLGSSLAQPIQNAIVQGFQIGVSLMVRPFEYFAKSLRERIEDEQSDIKAAGGIFSISRRQENPFVKTMDEAMEFTQENNKRMAELAAALPGNTQQYIEVSKRISDSISRIVTSDKDRAIQYANQLRVERGATQLEGTGGKAVKGAITELLGEMTKKTVLAGLGTGGGPGGVAGAYGLPQLTERMLTQQQVSMGQFQRYAAIFKDPLIMEALNRFIPKINASAAGTLERFQVMEKFYEEVLPPEMIRKYERSTAGILELFNTTIFGPETGLFGLGRKMAGMGKVMDDYGNYIKEFEDGTRKVVSSMEEASDANLSLFDMLRDSFANLGIALYPILSNLGAIFDPINKIAKLLVDFRHVSGRFLNSFEEYKKGFETMLKGMSNAEKMEFTKIGLDLRASLAAVNNFFADFGIISEEDFKKNAKQLMSTTFDYKGMMGGMIDTFLNSDVASDLGSLIGEIIGTVLTEVSKVTGFISGRLKQSSKLFAGLKKGFEEAGGPAAFKNIFLDVFKTIGNLLWEFAKIIPLEAYILGAAMLVIPAAVQGLGMLIAQSVTAALGKISKMCGPLISKSIGAAACGIDPMGGGRGRKGKTGLAGGFMVGGRKEARMRAANIARIRKQKQIKVGLQGKVGANSYTSPIGPLPAAFAKGPGGPVMASRLKGLPKALKGIQEFGKQALPFAKKLPGLSIALGALDFGLRKAAGQGTGEAAGGAVGAGAGSVLGGALGSFLGPGGTIAGAVLGGWLGDWLGANIGKVLDDLSSDLSTLPTKLNQSVLTIKNWFLTLPETFGGWLGATTVKLNNWANVTLPQIADSMQSGIASLRIKLETGWTLFKNRAGAILSDPVAWSNLVNKMAAALVRGIQSFNPMALVQAGMNLGKRIAEAFKTGATVQQAITPTAPKTNTQTWALMRYDGGNKGAPLSKAITSEMKHKPAGSDLVIANSSETVIPAAGGYGMKEFIDTMRSGFNAIVATYRETQTRQESTLKTINSTLISNQQQTNAKFAALQTKFSTPSIPGGLGGGAAGGVDAFTPIAQRFGLQMTSGYRPGDPGWHGANRARDFSNGTGPTPQMLQFAQYMASAYGKGLKELIYTPLGYSIKDGQLVPAYAQGSHYNHVHVAYAAGPGTPAFFGNQQDAISWEKKHLGAGVKSITSNTAELSSLLSMNAGPSTPIKWDETLKQYVPNQGGGRPGNVRYKGFPMQASTISPGGMYSNRETSMAAAPINITAPITINQQPGQKLDADELASIVAIKIGDAVEQARLASLFV